MNVTQQFVNNLPFKGGWRFETIGDKTFLTLTDPIYCNVFWVYYWYHIGSKEFKNQTFMRNIANGDITQKVIIDNQTGNIILPPSGWNLISYLGKANANELPPLYVNFAPKPIIIIYTIVMIFIMFFIIFFKPNKIITV